MTFCLKISTGRKRKTPALRRLQPSGGKFAASNTKLDYYLSTVGNCPRAEDRQGPKSAQHSCLNVCIMWFCVLQYTHSSAYREPGIDHVKNMCNYDVSIRLLHHFLFIKRQPKTTRSYRRQEVFVGARFIVSWLGVSSAKAWKVQTKDFNIKHGAFALPAWSNGYAVVCFLCLTR